jgi:hypothetical protein
MDKPFVLELMNASHNGVDEEDNKKTVSFREKTRSWKA